MSLKKGDHKRIGELREKRMRLAQERENARRRQEYGPKVVTQVNAVLSTQLSLEDFDPTKSPSAEFKRTPRMQDSEGLVISNANRSQVLKILMCCSERLGQVGGLLEFYEYREHLGFAEIPTVDLHRLLLLAEVEQESILFYPTGYSAVILIDYYRMGGAVTRNHVLIYEELNYSLIVQGEILEKQLQKCFLPPAPDPETSTIYVELPDNGSYKCVLCAIQGQHIDGNTFELLTEDDPNLAERGLKYAPGSAVECEWEEHGGNRLLVAKRMASGQK